MYLPLLLQCIYSTDITNYCNAAPVDDMRYFCSQPYLIRTQVMSVVRQLTTDTGITVVSTIHSPTAFCFNLFDQTMILLKGRVVYFGDNGE